MKGQLWRIVGRTILGGAGLLACGGGTGSLDVPAIGRTDSPGPTRDAPGTPLEGPAALTQRNTSASNREASNSGNSGPTSTGGGKDTAKASCKALESCCNQIKDSNVKTQCGFVVEVGIEESCKAMTEALVNAKVCTN